MYLVQFADWLDTPVLRKQRLSDDANAHKLTTYYHWIQDDIDFITLDNAVNSEFDEPQLIWFEKIVQLDMANPLTTTIVVGSHEPPPDSIAANHAMDATPAGIATGRRVYADLLKAQNDAHKHVYMISSHQHFYMAGIFNTEYWRDARRRLARLDRRLGGRRALCAAPGTRGRDRRGNTRLRLSAWHGEARRRN